VRSHALVVGWDPPDPTDYVSYTVVSVENPPGTPVVVENVSGSGVTVTGLTPGTAYTISLKHVDRWAHESTVTTIGGTHTPTVTVADAIDFDAAAIAGSLGWTSIDQITDPNVMGDDVIVARAMAVQDAAALNLWVDDASIVSAKIANLTAGKITTGTLQAGVSITAGGTKISDVGVELRDSALTEGSYPDDATSDWFSPLGAGGGAPTPFAGMGFYTDTTLNTRGILMRASAISGGSRKARVIISADDGDQDMTAASSARIRLESNPAGALVKIKGQVILDVGDTVEPIDGLTQVSGTLSPGAQFINSTGIKIFKVGRMCIMQGRVDVAAGGATTTNNICTLPSYFRPANFHYTLMAVQAASGSVWDAQRRIVIESGTGNIHLAAGETMVGGRTISLDGITYCLD
jgi:hypothetical protein